jgi:hypothetical protein
LPIDIAQDTFRIWTNQDQTNICPIHERVCPGKVVEPLTRNLNCSELEDLSLIRSFPPQRI